MDRTLTIEDLKEIQGQLQPAQNEWYNIGLALGLKVPVLDGLNELRNNLKRFQDMLKAVLNAKHDVTWKKIIEALRSDIVQLNALAYDLEKKYDQPVSKLAAGRKRQRGASGDQPETSKRAKTDNTRSANCSSADLDSSDDDIVPLSEFQYEMKSREALIINISKFSDPEKNRAGSEQDVLSLWQMLVTLGYKVDVRSNLNSDEIIRTIFNHANRNETCDSFICCILTHGKEGVIIGSDGKAVEIEKIATKLNKVRHLRGHPKIFFFQACSGNNASEPIELDNDATMPKKVLKLPPDSDYFYGFASAYGTPALRNKQSGSYYIQALCKIMQSQYNKDEDLSTMVTRVHYKVAKEERVVEGNDYQQQPQLVSTLRKRVHF